jgi:hypothetical protein
VNFRESPTAEVRRIHLLLVTWESLSWSWRLSSGYTLVPDSRNCVQGVFSEVRLHDLPALKHAADEKRLERRCWGGQPLLMPCTGRLKHA